MALRRWPCWPAPSTPKKPLFWSKAGLYLAVGALSLYPTITYILWATPLRKGELPTVSEPVSCESAWYG